MPIRTTTKSSSSVSTIAPSVTTQRPSPSTTYNPDKIQLSKYTVIRLLIICPHEKCNNNIFSKLFNYYKNLEFKFFILMATYITFIY